MHELSVTQGLVQIVTDQVKGTNVTRVYRVNLVIGELASIVDESVQFYFDILSRGTVAERAELSVQRVAAKFTCKQCGFLFETRSPSYKCLACGANDVLVTSGDEFYVDSIEVETDDTV